MSLTLASAGILASLRMPFVLAGIRSRAVIFGKAGGVISAVGAQPPTPPLHSPPRTTVEFGVADWTAARLTKARKLFHIWIV